MVEAGEPAVEDAEGESLPALDVEGAVEEGLALDGLAVDGHGQRTVARRGAEGGPDTFPALVRAEGDRGAAGQRGIFAGNDPGFLLSDEALGREFDPPAGHGCAPGGARPRRNDTAALRQRIDAHAGGVLALCRGGVPAALTEGEQHGRVGDAESVVGDGDDGAALGQVLGGDVDAAWRRCGVSSGSALLPRLRRMH